MDSFLRPTTDPLWHAKGRTVDQPILIEDEGVEDHDFALYMKARVEQIQYQSDKINGLPAGWTTSKLRLMEILFQQCMSAVNQSQ